MSCQHSGLCPKTAYLFVIDLYIGIAFGRKLIAPDFLTRWGHNLGLDPKSGCKQAWFVNTPRDDNEFITMLPSCKQVNAAILQSDNADKVLPKALSVALF